MRNVQAMNGWMATCVGLVIRRVDRVMVRGRISVRLVRRNN